MQKLHGRNLILVGFTLFSMFFGAGNLIFPPFLGAEAGSAAWLAFLGFAMSAIGLPVLGVIAVARSGGLSALAGRVHPRFAAVFTLLIYLSIGPCLAIPRTASTSFEMFAPIVGGGAAKQAVYSVLFFAVAFLVALRPDKLTDRLGKILCPTLIVLIIVLFAGCLLHPVAAHYGVPTARYTIVPAAVGFLGGYQTMDTIAALNFGAVIALNIRAKGIAEDKQVVRGTIRAGWIAGALLLTIYAMLTHAGALSGAAFPGGKTGADTLSSLAYALFGTPGLVLLAAIFLIACLNTCIGLISCVSEYFHGLFPRVSYRAFAAFFSAASMVVSNIGLAGIIRLSTPVLGAIYPAAIALIALSFVPQLAAFRLVHPLTVGLTCVQSVTEALAHSGLSIPFWTNVVTALPLTKIGFGWVLPALTGLLLGLILSRRPLTNA
ncbi:branched-chain amino acid transport system II carrier protein [Candidatus Agathobaculum pullicola]|uniref:branched-chain amino acid transport system II carrier protein n=1 Tax=Candidatus Agathobaculum pullicola TaxID=2838426 RepID=UPI003F8DB2CE